MKQCTETREAFNRLVKIEQNITVAKSIENSPLICTEGNKIDIIKQIIIIIRFFLEVTGKELEDYQIKILAGDIYEKFKTDTLDDVIIMFKMARQGDFGNVYKCDTFEIMNWARKYLELKSATREKMISKQKNKVENEEITGKRFHELPQEMQDKFNCIGRKSPLTKQARELLSRHISNRK